MLVKGICVLSPKLKWKDNEPDNRSQSCNRFHYPIHKNDYLTTTFTNEHKNTQGQKRNVPL